ncbi:RDD family protein [Euzebya rosea]|uniref:RDD family protein n=1 Tax=Euzebya rosea TaxID=2052804 RepID=UPI0013003A7A|nr:RDD family protein [Euzebya rosea]
MTTPDPTGPSQATPPTFDPAATAVIGADLLPATGTQPPASAPVQHSVGAPVGVPVASHLPVDGYAAGPRSLSSVGRLILAALLDGILMIVTLSIGWLVWACITASAGQTPGKKLMGMQVVDARTGAPLSWGSYVGMRGIVGGFVGGLASTLTLGVLSFMPLWDKQNQSVAAKVSNSVVVDV